MIIFVFKVCRLVTPVTALMVILATREKSPTDVVAAVTMISLTV